MKTTSTITDSQFDSTDKATSGFNYSVQISRLISTPIGLWPLELGANIFQKFFFEYFIVILCYFLICFFIVACGMHAVFIETNPRLQVKILGPISFCFMAIAKYSILILRRDKIRRCLKHMDVDWRKFTNLEDRAIMLKNAKQGKFVGYLCASFMYGGGIFYRTVLPLSIGARVTPDNVTIRPLICKVYEPIFGGRDTPSYELCFTGQWFSGFVVYSISISTCSLAAVFVLHACGQLKIVTCRLNTFVEGGKKVKNTLEGRIADIVELHLRVLRFIFRIEDILNEICLVEIIGCTWNICFLGYYVLTEVSQQTGPIAVTTWCILFTSFTFDIFIFCYIGEMLMQQGKKVGMTAYMIDWYKLPGKNAKGLILLLAMSNYPANITAGKMIGLSYASFCSVLKTAAAYFNLIRTMIL